MKKRALGPFEVTPIGLGCMNLSHAYGPPAEPAHAAKLLHEALDQGYDMLDTAALYGFGNNETLIGQVLKERRQDYVLASKCGMFKGPDGKRAIDGRPEVLRKTCEESLLRLQTDVIDLYYLHRWDKSVPIEDSVGALSDLVQEGKIRAIGLSEVSVETIEKAMAVHPVAAVQTEYSLWTRNVELGVLDLCERANIALVAFSPLARAFLCDAIDQNTELAPNDIRRGMPRFQEANLAANLALLPPYRAMTQRLDCTPAQLALAWLLAKRPCVIPIPGTQNIDHMKENFGALSVELSAGDMAELDALINERTVSGERYNKATQSEIDTEQFALAEA